jgi:hypothetical protein
VWGPLDQELPEEDLDDAVNPHDITDLASLNKALTASTRMGVRRVVPTLRYSVDVNAEIYLGGSCDPTTWRRDLAIPLCEMHHVTYYNPQVDNWVPEMVVTEAKAKEESMVLFFVIDNSTRAIGSMLEASEYIGRGRNVVLVVQPMGDDACVGKDKLPPSEVKDLNRARTFLRDVAVRHGVPIYTGVDGIVHGIQDAIARSNGLVDLTPRTEHDATIQRLQELGEVIATDFEIGSTREKR